MALLNCIKIRVPSESGWKDCRMIRGDKQSTWQALTDYDRALCREMVFEVDYLKDAVMTVETSCVLEVIWQGDEFPE